MATKSRTKVKKAARTEIKAQVCLFYRTRKSKAEQGIAINEVDIIIDMDGKPLKKKPWDYLMQPYLGCFIYEEPK